jgi:hypothetical protein
MSDLEGHGTAIRYARILLPFTLWLGAAGRPEVMPYIQPLIMVASAAAIAAAMQALMPRAGRVTALAAFMAIGVTVSLAGGFAEPLAVAFSLWAVFLLTRQRWIGSATLFGLAMLTRENAGLLLAGAVIWLLLARRRRESVVIGSSLVPVAGWHLLLRARFGFLPLADPFLRSQTDTVDVPIVALWRTVTTGSGPSITVMLVHVALAVLAIALWRRSLLWTMAAAAGIQLLFAGPYAWRYIGDAVRLGVFLQVFVVLALVARATPPEKSSLMTEVSSSA